MKTLTIRDFRTRPRQVRESLVRDKEAVLTASGKPVAVMIPVDSGSLDDTLEALRRARAQQAVRAMRSAARDQGLDRLSSAAIDSLISKTRVERRRTRGG